MREIIWEQCLEKNDRTLFIQIEKINPHRFEFSEGVMPPGDPRRGPHFNFPMGPKRFSSAEAAMGYAESNYIPGRRTQGWMLKEI